MSTVANATQATNGTPAVTVAGGDINGDEDALAFDQGDDGRPLWNSIPTLQAYRVKHAETSEGSSKIILDEGPGHA